MKLLLTCFLFTLPFLSFGQANVNFSMLDSTENAVLHRHKDLEYSLGVHNELINLVRTPDDGLKLVFKKHDGNATTYDYDTYLFDKNDKCKSISTVVSLGRLSTFLGAMHESGFETTSQNFYFNKEKNIKAVVESDTKRKIFTVTYTKK